MSWFDDLEVPPLKEIFSGVKDVATSVLGVQQSINDARFASQMQGLQLMQGQAAIDVARTNVSTQSEIAKIQAQIALKNAQAAASGKTVADVVTPATVVSGNGFDQILSNINTKIGQGSGVMLWLTVAGVAIAALSYVRR